MELISTVIITYKRPLKVLSRAVQSVLNQTHDNLELIIVNDAPEEKMLAQEIYTYIDSLKDQRIKYVEHVQNSGANVARNTGLNYATGKYIAYLDDDDEWLPQKLEKQLTAIQQEHNIGLVYSGFYINDDTGNNVVRSIVIPKKDYLAALIEDNYIGSTSFPLLLTEAVRKVGGFDTQLKSCQEYELWLRIAQKYKIQGIRDILGVYHISQDSTFKGNYKSYLEGDTAILSIHIDLFKEYPVEYSNHLLRMYVYMLNAKEFKKALYYKKRAFLACWYNINNLTLVYYLRQSIKKLHRWFYV